MSAGDASIIPAALAWRAEGRDVALATVIQTWGSAPQPVGSQLAIDGQGNFIGSVSGGCVEGEVIAEAAEVLLSAKPKTLEFGVEDGAAWKVGLACGGTIRVFLEPLEGASGAADLSPLQQLASDIEARHAAVLVTDLATGARRLVHGPAELGPDLAPAVEDAFGRDRSLLLEGGRGEIFINVFNPTIRLVMVGAVHVAQALLPMARVLGYDSVVADPRAAFASKERFGDVALLQDWPDEALSLIGIDPRTAVVVLSHDAKIDDAALIAALRSEAFYIGALGSRKSHAARVERLRQAGVADADIARIRAPIGLDIGAIGPAEIALSIIAEIAAVARGKSAR
jgi:xanthine dehydrogenase accessory factor